MEGDDAGSGEAVGGAERSGPEAMIKRREAVKVGIFSRILVNHTRKVLVVSIVVPLICAGVLVALKALTLATATNYDYLIVSSSRVQETLAIIAARDEVNEASKEVKARTVESESRGLHVLFRGVAGNVLTAEKLARMKSVENELRTSVKGYQRHCFLDQALSGDTCPSIYPLACSAIQSLITAIPNAFYEPCSMRNATTLLADATISKSLDVASQTFLGRALLSTDYNASSHSAGFARSYYPIGNPVEGFLNENDRKGVQNALYEEFVVGFASLAGSLSDEILEIAVYGLELSNVVLSKTALMDFAWALASITFVSLYMCLNLRSWYLGLMATLQIILAFPVAWFIYRVFFQIRYFAQLHILSVFLILGIGADDVFVYTDAWLQADVYLGQDCPLQTRIAWVQRRAAKATLVTSFTTAMAFFVTAANPIMPISTFGVWAACLILLQYSLCIFMYPTNLIIWHRFWKPKSLFPKISAFLRKGILQRNGNHDSEEEVIEETKAEFRAIEQFFHTRWVEWMDRFKYIVIVVSVVFLSLAIWRSSRLKPLTETEVFLPDSNPVRKGELWLHDEFGATSISQLVVLLSFGILGLDRTGTDRYNPENIGSAVYDEKFSLARADLQKRLVEICQELRNREELNITEIQCLGEDFRDYLNTTRGALFTDFASDEDFGLEIRRFLNFTTSGGVQPYASYENKELVGFKVGSNLVRFVVVEVRTNVDNLLPFSASEPVYQSWRAFVDEVNAKSPESLNDMLPTAGISWMWPVTQESLVSNCIRGIGISISVAFGALLLSTMNIFVALMATACVGAIVAHTLALMELLGWQLGITETISAVIIVGFSVDYVVHIANAYVECEEISERKEKTREALTTMGISVIAGSISTMGSGVFLWGAQIIFFRKFAAILMMTIFFSLIWTFFSFTSLLLAFGPNRNFGSLGPALRRLLEKFGVGCQRGATDTASSPLHENNSEIEAYEETKRG